MGNILENIAINRKQKNRYTILLELIFICKNLILEKKLE